MSKMKLSMLLKQFYFQFVYVQPTIINFNKKKTCIQQELLHYVFATKTKVLIYIVILHTFLCFLLLLHDIS